LPPQIAQSPFFMKFAKDVNGTLQGLTGALELVDALKVYAKEGNTGMLVNVLTSALDQVASVANNDFLRNTGYHIARFMSALSDVLQGAGTSLDFIEEGEQLTGISSLFSGLMAAIDGLVPVDLQNNNTYVDIVKGVEGELGGMLRDVLTFVYGILDSGVCWKKSLERERFRPTLCGPGYHLADVQWCLPDSGGGKVVRATCLYNAETQGQWCLQPCAPGYAPFNRHCKQSCLGHYYVESPLLCGSERGSVAFAITEMIAKTGIAAVTKKGLVEIVIGAGFMLASTMTSVVSAFADFAKPFGHSQCPEVFAGMDHSSMR